MNKIFEFFYFWLLDIWIKNKFQDLFFIFENQINCNESFFLWHASGHESPSYHQLRVSFRGESVRVYGHQLAFWVSQNFSKQFDPSLQISHLCHLPSCAKPEHLTLETAELNNTRKKCCINQKCQGHGQFQDCIFWKNIDDIGLIAVKFLYQILFHHPFYSKALCVNSNINSKCVKSIRSTASILSQASFVWAIAIFKFRPFVYQVGEGKWARLNDWLIDWLNYSILNSVQFYCLYKTTRFDFANWLI